MTDDYWLKAFDWEPAKHTRTFCEAEYIGITLVVKSQ